MLLQVKNNTDNIKSIFFILSDIDYIYIYSFSRRFYPKRLIIEEYNKRYIIKRQTDTGSACNIHFFFFFTLKINTMYIFLLLIQTPLRAYVLLSNISHAL